MNHSLLVFCSIVCLLWASTARAQVVLNEKEIRRGTTMTTDSKAGKNRTGGGQRRLDQIVKRSTKTYYYGNLCVKEVSAKMGFEYVVMPPGVNRPRFVTNQYYNLKTKVKLTLKHGPWWRLTFKNRVKKCRYRTGDFVG